MVVVVGVWERWASYLVHIRWSDPCQADETPKAFPGTPADLFDLGPLLEKLYDQIEALPSSPFTPHPSKTTALLQNVFDDVRADPTAVASASSNSPTDLRDLIDGHQHPSVRLSHPLDIEELKSPAETSYHLLPDFTHPSWTGHRPHLPGCVIRSTHREPLIASSHPPDIPLRCLMKL